MPSASSSRRSFTLVELLLVIFLIAILYGVFISKMKSGPETSGVPLSLETLDRYLAPIAGQTGRNISFVCRDSCRACDLYADGKRLKGDSVSLFDTSPEVYRMNSYGQYRQVEFTPVNTKDGVVQDVCFRYTLFANGSRSSYIVYYDDAYYVFDAYLRAIKKYKKQEEAETAYEKASLIPDDERRYTF